MKKRSIYFSKTSVKSSSSPKGNGELKLQCCLQVEDSLMEILQIYLIHGDVINDNRGRLGYAYEETQSWKSEKAPRGLDI